jgi:hypothetical protein
MANTAPYEVNVTGTDDETFVFAIPFENADGTEFPFDEYEIEYSLSHRGSRRLLLTQGSGITIDNGVVAFSAARPMQRGQYEHGCRLRRIANDQLIQVFDGAVTIGEGNFR